jgi:hypothetical protein
MRGKRVKQIKKDLKELLDKHPSALKTYGYRKLYKDAKRAWKENG